MYVSNRQTFDTMLNEIKAARTLVFDTEGTGLFNRHGDRTIGISVYLPDSGNTYYFAWGHGRNDTPTIATVKQRDLALEVYREHFQDVAQADNMPFEWLEELKEAWTYPTLFIGHNIQFDLTALDVLGFPLPRQIADTMSMLAVVNSDWNGNPEAGFIPTYKMPDTGNFEKGGRGLKWQSRLWGLESAQAGINALDDKIAELNQAFKTFNPKADLKLSSKAPAQAFLWMLSGKDVSLYAEDDTRLTWLLYNRILGFSQERWGDEHLHTIYNNITYSVWLMQRNGFNLDIEQTQQQVNHTRKVAAQLLEEICSEVGDSEFNPASNPQVLAYFQNVLNAPITSTGKEVLEKLGSSFPIAKKILAYRKVNKLETTYAGKWLDNHVNGIIHPEYGVGGTATGRLSSSSEKFNNFQNIPKVSVKNEINPKNLLRPHNGYLFIDLDYQALEMRLIAWVAEKVIPDLLKAGTDDKFVGRVYRETFADIGSRGFDTTLTRLIVEGADMHAYTMEKSGVYDLMLAGRDESTYLRHKGMRAESIIAAYRDEKGHDPDSQAEADKWYFFGLARFAAKQTNFSTVYGVGAEKLGVSLEIPFNVAKSLLNAYHDAYPMVRVAQRFLQRMATVPRLTPKGFEGQYIEYPLYPVNLFRKFTYYPNDRNKANAAWRAFSHTIQGTGGLVTLHSITEVGQQVGFDRVVPHATTHDSVTYGVRPENVGLVVNVMRVMENYNTYPPLKVDLSAGRVNEPWGSVRKIRDVNQWIKEVQNV